MHSKRLQAFDFNRMEVAGVFGPSSAAFLIFLSHGREIGQHEGPIHWPSRSPDLKPPDFFLWGYLNQKIRGRNPEDVPQLRTAITEIFRTITPEMCASACRNVYDRLLRCVANNGECIP